MDDDEQDAPPLVDSRGLLLVEDFCRASGLDQQTVQSLLASGRLDGAFDRNGRAFGLFNDALPSRQDLAVMGFKVNEAYQPEQLRGYEDDGESNEPPSGDESATWYMSWGDEGGPASRG